MAVYRGKDIRLTKEPSALMEKLDEPTISPAELGSYARGLPETEALHAFDKAHILTQLKAGTLAREDARAMLQVFRRHEAAGDVRAAREATGDYKILHSGEALLTASLGPAVGGKLHLGRSSGDLSAVAFKLTLRERLLALLDSVNELRRAACEAAARHADSLMPGYSHLQQAQPTTLGHWFSLWVANFERDFARLREFYARVNESPAGAGVLVGNEFHMDRAYEARLLGFDQVQVNTMDCVWGRDAYMECFSTLVMLASNFGRLAEDLQVWCASEFGFMELDDSHSGTSSIMPQKKNPYAAEYLKGVVGLVSGAFLQSVMVYKNPHSAAVHDGKRSRHETWRIYDEVEMAVRLTAEMVDRLVVHEDVMRVHAGDGWSTAADLAGAMVTQLGLPWRTAHQIIGIAVRFAVAEGIAPEQADQALLDRASMQHRGEPLGMSTSQIRHALDPANSVREHDMIGGPSPERVRQDLRLYEARLQADREWARETRARRDRLLQEMEREIDALLR